MPSCLLPERSIIAVSGVDAESLLNRLFTRSVLRMEADEARYAALLSPQGKLLFDFIVYRRSDGFWLDGPREKAAELAQRLNLFKMRAKVSVAAIPELAVAACWGSERTEWPCPVFRDPRHGKLGLRIVAPSEQLAGLVDSTGDYEAHRIALGVPHGGVDWAYGDTFVHDANLDLLHGVDFDKGCYVGQEVVSRVHHRTSARKRIVQLKFYGTPPTPGARLTAGDAALGTMTSVACDRGLASARIDRLAEAEGDKVPVTCGDTLVDVTVPAGEEVRTPS